MQKLGFIPEAQNDMIFSVICEELGLFGAMCLILLYLLINLALYDHCKQCGGSYGALIVVGVNGAYLHSGDPKYCRGNEHDSEYRNFAPVYQLRRNIYFVSALGNGAGAFGIARN